MEGKGVAGFGLLVKEAQRLTRKKIASFRFFRG